MLRGSVGVVPCSQCSLAKRPLACVCRTYLCVTCGRTGLPLSIIIYVAMSLVCRTDVVLSLVCPAKNDLTSSHRGDNTFQRHLSRLHRYRPRTKMAVLNSNPEVLLRKRKNNERKRLEKQEEARKRQLEQQRRKNKAKANKFIRAETLVSNHKSNSLERKRINNIAKHEQRERKLTKDTTASGEAKLLFVIRLPDHTKGLKIPYKAAKVLEVLRLKKNNTGVFVKVTPTVESLLKLISPYVVAGKPSLTSIRKLFQKRACVSVIDEETKASKSIKLDNNAVVEEKFGDDLGLICIEDIIHEIASLGENFKAVSLWLNPFVLNTPANGWGPQAKLARLQYSNERKRKISLAGNTSLQEIDIDQFIDEQN